MSNKGSNGVQVTFGTNGGVFEVISKTIKNSVAAGGEFVCLDIANIQNKNEKISLRVFSDSPVFNQAKNLNEGDKVFNVFCNWKQEQKIKKEENGKMTKDVKLMTKPISFEIVPDDVTNFCQLSKAASSAIIGTNGEKYRIIDEVRINDKGYITFVLGNVNALTERYIARCFPDAPFYDKAKELVQGDVIYDAKCSLVKRSFKQNDGSYVDEFLYGIRTFCKETQTSTDKVIVEARNIDPINNIVGFGK